MKRFATVVLLLLTVLLPTSVAFCAEPTIEPAAGELLVASAAMQDPRFQRSVILILRHDASGAFGIAINRPLGQRPIGEILADASGASDKDSARDAALDGTIHVYLGGPVQPQYGFVIHGEDYRRPETLTLGNGLAMTSTADVLRDIARHQGPAKYLFALGYAGWSAGQLEGEIARRDWFTAPADACFVFDEERSAVWDRALARRVREL